MNLLEIFGLLFFITFPLTCYYIFKQLKRKVPMTDCPGPAMCIKVHQELEDQIKKLNEK